MGNLRENIQRNPSGDTSDTSNQIEIYATSHLGAFGSTEKTVPGSPETNLFL